MTTTDPSTRRLPNIPATCKAGVVVNEGPDFRVEIQDVPVPEPGPTDLLLRLTHTGLCMSDIHFMSHDWSVPPMSAFSTRCAGHEGVGTVVALGSSVTEWSLGDRGGIKPLLDVCHSCHECWTGKENYCQKGVYTGLVRDGTYQQYVAAPARYTSRVPAGVPGEVAAPVMCSASTMHRALIDMQLRGGDWVVFPGGGGGVGVQGVQLAKAMGLRAVVVDRGQEKKNMCEKMGAEAFVDFGEVGDVVAEVKRVCDGVGAQGVVVTAPQAYGDAVGYIGERIGGKVVCVGLPPAGSVELKVDPNHIIFKNLTIMGSLVGTMSDTAAALEYARRGLLQNISEVRPLSAMPESVQQLRRGEIAGRVVIDFDQ